MKVGYIDNGLHSYKAFKSFPKFTPIPLTKVRKINLNRFDVLIIPFHTDQATLAKCKKKLEAYLRGGGTLIILGAMESYKQWLPYGSWNGGFIRANSFKISKKSEILKGLENEILKKGVHAHGTLTYLRGDKIIEDLEGNGILILDTKNFLGNYLITTLDPDHHCLKESPGMNEDITNISKRLLENIISWAEDIYQKNKNSDIKWKMKRHIFIITGFFDTSLFTFLFLSCLILLLLYFSIQNQIVFTIVTGIASFLSLAYEFLRD